MTIQTSSVTVQHMSTGENMPYKNPNDVNFKIQYSKEFKGTKYHVDGETVIVSKEVAADLTARGIGHIVTDQETKKEKGKK